MLIDDAIEDILVSLHFDKDIITLSKKFFPYEKFNDSDEYNEGIIDDMLSVLVHLAESDNQVAEEIYFFLHNEKITIDEEEIYSEEEIIYG